MKTWKRWAAALLLGIVCFSLAGCHQLDEMKRNMAYQKDGNLILGGKVYRPIGLENTYFYNPATTGNCVNDPEIPVLLSGVAGNQIMISDDRTAILFTHMDFAVYVEESCYEEYVQMLREPERRVYATTKLRPTGERGITVQVPIQEEQKQALLAVLRRRAASVDDRREFIAPIEDVSCLIGPLVAVDYKVQILRDLDTGIVYLSIEGESAFADEAPLYPATEQEGALLLSIAENQYVEPSTTTI